LRAPGRLQSDMLKLAREAQKDCLVLDEPHPALLVQGDDELGALAHLERLSHRRRFARKRRT